MYKRQAYSAQDRYCSPERQTLILQLILRFIELAEDALDKRVAPQAIAELRVLRGLHRMGEEIGEDNLGAFDDLRAALESAMAGLREGKSHAA